MGWSVGRQSLPSSYRSLRSLYIIHLYTIGVILSKFCFVEERKNPYKYWIFWTLKRKNKVRNPGVILSRFFIGKIAKKPLFTRVFRFLKRAFLILKLRRKEKTKLRDKIVELRASLKDLPTEEIRQKLGDLKKSELMRSIILNEKQYCNCTYERSQRNFWYSVVKPTLDKLGKLTTNDDTEEGLTGWDKTLSKYLTELVKEGQLTYKDIMICDESRNYSVPAQYAFSPYRNIIVACEKDTIFQFVKDISTLLGCSCISSKGICGFGAMETLLRKIRDNSENKINELVFLIMSDYDPTGYIIANTFKVQAEIMAQQLGMNARIIAKRI